MISLTTNSAARGLAQVPFKSHTAIAETVVVSASAEAPETSEPSGVTASERVASEQRAIRNARKDASACACCERKIAPGEPVWRQRINLGRSFFGGVRQTKAPVCRSCKKADRYFRPHLNCAGCGRPVYHQGWRRPGHIFCSEICQREIRLAAARDARRQSRAGRVCENCGEAFEPSRSDSKFCCLACKQRAYRQRVRGFSENTFQHERNLNNDIRKSKRDRKAGRR
jgi:ribosomal protein L32